MSRTNMPRPTAMNTLGLAQMAVTNPPVDCAAATKNRRGQFTTDMVFNRSTIWRLGCEGLISARVSRSMQSQLPANGLHHIFVRESTLRITLKDNLTAIDRVEPVSDPQRGY